MEVYITGDNASFLIDQADMVLIQSYCWRLSAGGYVYTVRKVNKSCHTVYLHCLLMHPQDKEQIDHINHNRADNRRHNLRTCSVTKNAQNRLAVHAGFKGVQKNKGKFSARINLNQKQKHLGLFSCVDEAAAAYDFAATLLFGKYANLNNSNSVLTMEQQTKIKNKVDDFISSISTLK